MDSRFHLKVRFSIYGKEYPWDCSLNWCAEPDEIDRRITEFFRSSYETARAAYEATLEAEAADAMLIDREREERAELQRLREKYP